MLHFAAGIASQLLAITRQNAQTLCWLPPPPRLREGTVRHAVVVLPSKVSKCFICLCHPMSGFFLGACGSFALVCRKNFCEQRFVHRLAFGAFSRFHYPAHAERHFAGGIHLARHLVVGTAYAA